MWSSPLGWLERLQFFYHGLHYLVAVPVAALHLLIGWYFLQNLAPIHVGAAALAGAYLATRIAASQKTATTKLTTRGLEFAALFVWFFPAAVIAVNLMLAILANDAPRALPPVSYAWQIVGLVCFAAPPVVLLAGLAGFRQLGAGTFGAVVVTYPAAFYLDIAGVLMGLTDLVAGWSPWHAVTRSQAGDGELSTYAATASDRSVANTADESAPGVVGVGIRRNWRLRDVPAALGARPARLRQLLIRKAPAGAKEPYTMKSLRWIVPVFVGVVVAPEKLPEYCEDSRDGERTLNAKSFAGGTGTFRAVRNDRLQRVDPAFWERLDSTFFCNLARFRPENVSVVPDGGVRFDLLPVTFGDRKFTAGSLATKDQAGARFLYGRFEVSLKPVRGAGVVTAFFLYRFDPWQEIDTEFLGDDTTKLLLNVFYNPGEPGDQYNYGFRGTPVVIDLGFDAAEDFHTYALEWDPEEIRWFVDGALVHSRRAGRPTPIPHLPMRFYMNVWPTCSAELAGAFDPRILPAAARFQSVKIYGYQPAAFPAYSTWIESFFSDENGPRTWRDDADWMQPRGQGL